MKKIISNIKYLLICIFISFVSFVLVGSVSAQVAPSFHDNFSKYMVDGSPDENGNIDTVYDIKAVSPDKSLQDNIRCLFYPSNYSICGSGSPKGGFLWGVFKYVGLGIFVLFLCVLGVKLVLQPDKAPDNLKSLIFVLYGGALFFGCVWILGNVLKVESLQGSAGLIDALQGDSSSLGFKVVVFFKVAAFFVAIVMAVIQGFKAFSQANKADKAKEAIKGVINVVVALIIIKIVDYLYYMVQSKTLVADATSFILEVAKILGFVVGILLVLIAFYAGFLFITDGGKGDGFKKATKLIVGIILVATVIFVLLLIMYQLFAEFA